MFLSKSFASVFIPDGHRRRLETFAIAQLGELQLPKKTAKAAMESETIHVHGNVP